MQYIITLFWSFILGQVVGYIGSSLLQDTYDFKSTAIISLITGVIIILIGTAAKSQKKT